MKTTGIVLASLLLVSAGSSFAQTGGLSVKKGTTYSFDSKISGQMTQAVNGQEHSNELKSGETVKLTPTKIDKSRIEWNCVVADVGMASKNKGVQKLVTDAAGNILDVIGGSQNATLTAGTMSVKVGSPKSRLRRYFLPQLANGLKPGDSWEDAADDTTTLEQAGLTIRSHMALRYTFEGFADTLGFKTARIRWESTALEISGESSGTSMKIKVVGDGTTGGVAYYSLADGLLAARNENLDARLRLNVQEMIIPVVQQQTTTTVRVKS